MARSKKHVGFGKWVVLDDGVQVAGPMDKEEAEAMILDPPTTPAAVVDGDRAYRERLAADIRQPRSDELEEIRAILAKRRPPREVEIMARLIWPILKAGRRARPRGSNDVMLPPAQANAA